MSSQLTNVIFIDESGDIGLRSKPWIQKKPYYVFGFVYCKDPSQLRKRLKRLLKRMHQRGKYPSRLGELKFYLPHTELIQGGYTITDINNYNAHMPVVRSKALGLITKYSDGVFATVLDKRKAFPTYTEEELGNYILARSFIEDVMNVLKPPNPPAILYDRGRLSPARSIEFNNYVVSKDSYYQYRGWKNYQGSLSPPVDTASLGEAGIWAADIVAGSFYHKHANSDWSYANMLTPSLIGGKERLFWP